MRKDIWFGSTFAERKLQQRKAPGEHADSGGEPECWIMRWRGKNMISKNNRELEVKTTQITYVAQMIWAHFAFVNKDFLYRWGLFFQKLCLSIGADVAFINKPPFWLHKLQLGRSSFVSTTSLLRSAKNWQLWHWNDRWLEVSACILQPKQITEPQSTHRLRFFPFISSLL